MSVAENDVFVRADTFSLTDIPDGLAVNDADGQEVHFLNPVAGAVFLLCDGTHDARTIAAILEEEFSLQEPPLQDVLNCLSECLSLGIVRKV